LKLDLLVDGRLVVEVKAADRLHPVHQAQVITYLKLTGCPAGLLLNFNATSLRAGLKRLDHPTIYAEKQAAKRSESRRIKENSGTVNRRYARFFASAVAPRAQIVPDDRQNVS
jgi:hypothetical protein